MNIYNQIKKRESLLIEYRNYLHINPELSGKEFNTLIFIKNRLAEYQIEYLEIDNGGILCWVKGKNDNGKNVLLRADIDALPIKEDKYNGMHLAKEVVSAIDGVAHMCGHDCHTSMLLNAIIFLQENRSLFAGTVYGIFERGEEANGNIFHILQYFEKNNYHFDSGFGMHVMVKPELPTATIILKEGNFYASMREFCFRIIGKGGHGSRPEKACSPIDCFADAYMQIKELKKKFSASDKPLTYSIGLVNSGTASNVIPETLEFAGSIRFYDMEYGKTFFNEILNILDSTCKKYGCHYETVKNTIPGFSVINNTDATRFAEKVFSEYMNVEKGEEMLITESFSFFQLHLPSTFAGLVVSNKEKGMTADIHTPQFEPDIQSLTAGCCCFVLYAISFLNENPEFEFTNSDLNAEKIIQECGIKLD